MTVDLPVINVIYNFYVATSPAHMGYKLGAWHNVVWLQRHLWRPGD